MSVHSLGFEFTGVIVLCHFDYECTYIHVNVYVELDIQYMKKTDFQNFLRWWKCIKDQFCIVVLNNYGFNKF